MSALDTLDDTALLARWREQDARAGAILVRRHHASVARFFMRKLGPDTEDLVQGTFLGLVEGLERFRGEASFRTLLFAIARNKLLKYLRDNGRYRARFDSAQTSIAESVPSPSSILAGRQQNKLLLAALRELPVDTQVMLELHYWEQLPIAAIGRVLDLPINTVKTRMRRGRLRLDERMQSLAESPAQLEVSMRGLEQWAAKLRQDLGDADLGSDAGDASTD